GRHAHFALRRGDERTLVVGYDLLAPEIAQKRANRGKFARRRRTRTAIGMERAKETPDGCPVECRGRERLRSRAAMSGDVFQKTRQVARVRADGVRRNVSVEREKLQEAFEVSRHRRPAPIARCSPRSGSPPVPG